MVLSSSMQKTRQLWYQHAMSACHVSMPVFLQTFLLSDAVNFSAQPCKAPSAWRCPKQWNTKGVFDMVDLCWSVDNFGHLPPSWTQELQRLYPRRMKAGPISSNPFQSRPCSLMFKVPHWQRMIAWWSHSTVSLWFLSWLTRCLTTLEDGHHFGHGGHVHLCSASSM